MNLLFVAGPARSGTTALAEYLNLHPEILLCMERYKWIPRGEVKPELFSFERIMEFEEEYEKRNTGERRQEHAELLAAKDPAKLCWIGDKNPNYVKALNMLALNNPGVSFILTYRPVEEVAESWEALSNDPEDPWLGGKDGFRLGVENWNEAMRDTRDFIEHSLNLNVLLVSYHDFFYRNEDCLPLISRFLDLDFDERMRQSWSEASRSFESTRRRKQSLSEEQKSFVEEHADREAEAAILKRIEEQWAEYGESPEVVRALVHERRRFAVRAARRQARVRESYRRLERRRMTLQKELGEERSRTRSMRQENRRLSKRKRTLEQELQSVRSSRGWSVLSMLHSVKEKGLSMLGPKKSRLKKRESR